MISSKSQKQNNEELVSMNLFRGFAGYGVAICHYIYFFHDIELFQTYSYFFVEFFFILSGFVLCPQIIKVFNNPNLIKIFYYRRWLRTLPAYLLALVIFSIMFKKFDFDTLKFLFLLQNIKNNFVSENYMFIAWSLSIEEYFYLLFPIFIILFKKKLDITQIIILFIIFILLIKLSSLFAYVSNFQDYRTNTLLRLDSIALGVLIRIYIHKINKKQNFILMITSFLFLLYFFPNIKNFDIRNYFILLLSIQFFSASMLVLFFHYERILKDFKEIGKLISKQTYSIYLFHMIFLYLLKNYETNGYLKFSIYFGLIFLSSILIYNYFEKPINKVRPEYE